MGTFETGGRNEGKESPYKPEAVTHLLHEHREVRPEDAMHIALHGTSLETVQALLSQGVLMGRQTSGEFGYQPGDISLYPTVYLDVDRAGISSQKIRKFMINPSAVRLYAELSAELNAHRHAFLSRLRLPWTPKNLEYSLYFLDTFQLKGQEGTNGEKLEYQEAITHFRSEQVTEDLLVQAAQAVQERKGFILGISPAVQDDRDYRVLPGDPGSEDVRMQTSGKGLLYKYISGIEPLGDVEAAFLDGLREHK